MNRIIDPATYPITPDMIDTSGPFWEAFGNSEKETSAWWVVKFCQEQGSWEPFSIEALEARYQQKFPGQRFHFNGLDWDVLPTIPEWIVRITHEFVCAVFRSRPASGIKAQI